MSHRVLWLQTQQSFQVEDDETVLAAALRQGLALPHECTFGGCGTCRMTVVEGEVRYEELPMALTEEEHQQGLGLACQARCRGDLVISIDTMPNVSPPVLLDAEVESISPLTDDVTLLRLKLPADHGVAYLPGQYLNIQQADGTHRSFSMANAPHDGKIDLHVRRIEGGRFTSRLHQDVRPGQTLRVELPHGAFYFREKDYQPMIFAATGTGVAPIKAILESLLDNDDLPPSRLYWGMRTQKDLYHLDQLAEWAKRLYEFEFVPVLSRPGPDWQGRTGYVQDAILADVPDLSEHSVYLCGSPMMINDAKERFVAAGADPARIYSDCFVFQHSRPLLAQQ